MSGSPDVAALADRVVTLVGDGAERVVIGITGAPGSGKSTLVEQVGAELDRRAVAWAWVPMDGFHLADATLENLGRLARKGAIDTFDGRGYVALLRRLHAERETVVYVPWFERTLEQPLAGAVGVPPEADVVLTEGNYLLDPSSPWSQVRAALTEAWFCDTDEDERRARLIRRHVRFGKTEHQARAWVDDVDLPNGVRIVARRDHADLIIH